MRHRCDWAGNDPLYVKYHDTEWGVPVHNDRKLFEMLLLEGAQAGLSWITILRKRENYRKAFRRFDPRTIARYGKRDVGRLLNDSGIVRNKLKISASIQNAKAFQRVQKEFGSFNAYVWRFVEGRPVVNSWKTLKEVPATTKESLALSRDLQRRGFNFVGPTICYSFMQAVGMVNDHLVSCFRHRPLSRIVNGVHSAQEEGTRGKKEILREFARIPGVGTSIANDLWRLGLRSTSELRRHDPEQLYSRFCDLAGKPVDRCLLYVFRCAVYYASNTTHDPALLRWWNWTDERVAIR